MGSTGTGAFGNYPGNSNPTNDMCKKNRKNIILEEVGRSEYFTTYGALPDIMEEVVLNFELKNGRLVVSSVLEDKEIGYLPSTLSSLLACMRKGFTYRGTVVLSEMKPFPMLEVNLHAEE